MGLHGGRTPFTNWCLVLHSVKNPSPLMQFTEGTVWYSFFSFLALLPEVWKTLSADG